MKILGTRWAFWTAVALGVTPCLLAAWSWTASDGPLLSADERDGAWGSRGGTDPLPVDSLSVAARRIAPFRPDGRPSGVPYDPMRSEAPEYQPAKPTLVLNGIMEGANPVAVIEGIPGREGPMVFGVGDTIAGLRVRRIKDGQVTVTGMDTTWQLRLKEQ